MQDPIATPEEIEEEIEEKKGESDHRNYFLIASAVFLILMVLPFFLAGPYTFDIIMSLFSTSKMDNLVLHGDNFTITFEKDTYNDLKDMYLEVQDREFKACLGGTVDGDDYHVTEILFPDQRGSYSQVLYTPCPSETIVSMHTHPYHHCRASEQDFRSFDEFRKTSPDAVMMIMCDVDRFYVYR